MTEVTRVGLNKMKPDIKEENMTQGTFQKVGQTEQRMYGPRAMLVCGFAPAEQGAFMKLIGSLAFADLPVIFAAAADDGELLGDLLKRPDQSGRDAAAGPARAVIMSGITENELHQMLNAYRQTGLPRPLWATLTPVSETWTLSALLAELEQERRAMEQEKA